MVTWQLLEEIIELIGPLQRIGKILAAHRLKLEHEAAGMIAEHGIIWMQHAVFEQGPAEKIGMAPPGEPGLRRILPQTLGGDPIPDFAHRGKSGWQRLRV